MASWLETVNEDTGPQTEFEPVLDPESGEVLYYRPKKPAAIPEAIPGTPLEQKEIPIPYVSLPDVEKPTLKPPPVYDVTPPEVVPETPAEQLEKLVPPKDTEAELTKLLETPQAPPPPEVPAEPEPETPIEKLVTGATKLAGGIRKATEPVRQVIAKPAAAIAAIPWMIPAGFEAIRGLQHQDEAERKISQADAAWLQEQGIGAYTGIHKILGAEVEPETAVEHVAGSLASSYVPGSKLATLSMFGVNEIMRNLKGQPATKSPEEKAKEAAQARVPQMLAELLLTPAEAAMPGPWPGTPGTAPAAPEPKGKKGEKAAPKPITPAPVPEPAPPGAAQPVTPPIGAAQPESILKKPSPPKMPVPKANEKPEAFLARQAEFEQKMKEFPAKHDAWLKQFNPSATTYMNTIGGQKEVKESDLWGMGIVAIGTAGMIATPYMYRAFRDVLVPRPMNAQEAAARALPVSGPGLVGDVITQRGLGDLFKAGTVNVNLALVRLGKKAMMPVNELDTIENMLRSGGHTQGQALIDSAIRLGEMRTNTMHFSTPVSLEKIGQVIAQTPNGNRYLIVRDVLDRITIEEAKAQNAGNQATQQLGQQLGKIKGANVTVLSAKAGPEAEITINGLNKEDALNIQSSLEAMNPDLKNLGKMWDQWNKDKRSFLVDGEAGTITKDKQKELNHSSPSHIPWNSQVGKDTPFEDRVSHTNIVDAMNYRSRVEFKDRLQNEIKLYWIDRMRKLDERYAKEITADEFNNQPEYHPYATKVFRRGKTEYYLTDRTTRDMLNLDPYMIEGNWGQAMNIGKRTIETVFTGNLNPAFSIKNALRVWHSAKHNTDIDRSALPSLWGMAKSVPQQVYPQLGKFLIERVEAGGGKRLSQMFGAMTGQPEAVVRQAMVDLGRRWAPIFDDHTYFEIERHGGARGSLLEQQNRTAAQARLAIADGDSKMGAAGEVSSRYWNHFKTVYKMGLGAVHEAPFYNYVTRNIGVPAPGYPAGKPLDMLIAEARNLGGDPKIGGQYFFTDKMVGAPGKTRPIAFDPESTTEKVLQYPVRAAGRGAEFVRQGPWGNAIMQSVGRVANSYLNNPAAFTGRLYQYTIAPASVNYLYNYSLGNDPNGISYVDHDRNRRTKYSRMTEWYIGIPGWPAEDGLRIPAIGLEMSLGKEMTATAWDHAFGTNKLDLKTDAKNALLAAMDISLNIPLNPMIAMWEVSQGRVPPMNVFGAEQIKRSTDPYDQYRTMPESIERFMRQLGGIGAAIGEGWAAYSHTDQGQVKAVLNGLSEAGKTQLRQIPVVNTLTDTMPKLSGSNRITEELYDNLAVIDQLVKHYKTKFVNAGMINTKPASVKGGEVADQLLGPVIPGITPGPPQPEPNNPLYKDFMATLYARFKRDNPGFSQKGEDLGGVGFVSIMRRIGDASAAIKSMEYVDSGLFPKWQAWLNKPENEELVTYLKANGVDTTNARQVRNFYEQKRIGASLTLLRYIKMVEDEFTAKARATNPNAPEVTLKSLQPYIKYPMLESQFPEAFSPQGMGITTGNQGIVSPF